MVISDKQKALVQEAWGEMQQHIDELGVTYFTKIFEIGPSTKERFSFLPEGCNIETAVQSDRLKRHAAEVFKMVCEGVVQMCDTSKLEIGATQAARMTSTHIRNGVTETDFPVYSTALTEAAKEFLRDKYTDDMGEALKEAHEELIRQMLSLEEHQKLIARMQEKINELRAAHV